MTGFLNGALGKQVYRTHHVEMELKQRWAICKRWSGVYLMYIVAESVMGAGIDQSGVRLVIHNIQGRIMINQ